jgi:low temperature requirement protein LtrA
VEGVGVYLTSRHGNWRLHSVAHLTERHGLFIVLAIGESVVAIGVGAAEQPISAPLLVAAILGMAAAVCLWWLYFDVVSLAAEQRLLEARGQARVDLAVEAYTYGHLPLVAGIVLAALGVEGVLAHAGDREPLGVFYALPLVGGVVLYLAGLAGLVVILGRPDRRRDHSLCADPTQPPRHLAASAVLTPSTNA